MEQDKFGKFGNLCEAFSISQSEIELAPGEASYYFSSWLLDRSDIRLWMPEFLKDAIICEAEATNSSVSVVVEASLRSSFTDSWENDKERQLYEHCFPQRRSPNRGVDKEFIVDTETEFSCIEFTLSNTLIDYLKNEFGDFDVGLIDALKRDFCKIDTCAVDEITFFKA